MACENLANFAITNLAAPMTNTDVTLTVDSSTGFPAAPFRIRIDTELLLVTNVSGVLWDVTRGEEGTTAVIHSLGDTVTQVLTAEGLLNLIECYSQSGPFGIKPSPSSTKVGRLYLNETPGWFIERNQFDATWRKWTGIYQLDEPSDSGFAWVNQGSATVTTSSGGIELVTPAPGSAGENVRLRVQDVSFVAPTSPPYIITAGFIPGLFPDNETSCGLVFRESSTGKFIFFKLKFDTTSAVTKKDLVLAIDKYDNPTTFNSSYNIRTSSILNAPLIWFQIEDDNTDLIWRISNDNKKFITIDTRARTDFLASGPDQFGIAVNSTITTSGCYMTLLSLIKE
jgi:hypothetical protein